MKFVGYNIVFQEIPDEITLAINISNCPNRCEGCHSPHLQEDTGEELTERVLYDLLEKYGNAVTCVCFMGGDNSPEEVLKLASFVRKAASKACHSALDAEFPEERLLIIRGLRVESATTEAPIKTAWYSGNPNLYDNAQQYFDYIKLGKYMEELGGLNYPTTNQRFYRVEDKEMIDITERFYNNE